jgi:hypothetical protein
MPHKLNTATQCQHRTKDRKQCQMPVAQASACVPLNSASNSEVSTPVNLCPHHQRTAASQIYQSTESRHPAKDPAQIEALATALLANTNNLSDPAQVNQFLANLLNQLAHNKISRKNAIAMAYISQLLLNSISVRHKQDRDAQAAQQAAQANKPTQIIIDVDRPNFASCSCSGEPSGRHSSEFRSGETLDSRSVDVSTVPAIPNHAPKNPPPTDDPPPSTHPKHVPLPRWGEQHFPTGTYSEPSRPNQFGPPRMSARRATRRRSPRALARLGSTGILACARLTHRRDFALGRRRPRTKPGPFVRCRSAASAFSLHLSCFA